MKNLFLLLLLSLSISCIAQVEVGVKVGASVGDLSFSNRQGEPLIGGFHPRAGFQGGIYANFQLCERFSISPEIVYAAKGARTQAISIQEVGIPEVQTHRIVLALDYISIPLMANYHLNSKWRLEAGPELGYLVSGKLIEKLGGYRESIGYERLDFSMNLGAGMALTSRWDLSLRYSHGLVNLLPITQQYTATANRRKNRAAYLALGYQIW